MTEHCTVDSSNGADRICINPDCTLKNIFVCGSCEDFHDHNGSQMTIKLKKINDFKSILAEKTAITKKILENYDVMVTTVNTFIANRSTIYN